MTETLTPPAEEPQGCESTPGFVKSHWENNQHYVNQFAGHPWEPAIHEAAEEIHRLCPKVNISQIKEKFGDLRFYYDIPQNLTSDDMAAWLHGDVEKLRIAIDQTIARAEGWCAGHDATVKTAAAIMTSNSPDFERGAKAAAEAMRFYFLDENEQSIYVDLSAQMLEQHEAGAIADALVDEQRRLQQLDAQAEQ